MNERILNSFRKLRVAKTLRSNCEAVSVAQAKQPCQSDRLTELVLVDSETEEA